VGRGERCSGDFTGYGLEARLPEVLDRLRAGGRMHELRVPDRAREVKLVGLAGRDRDAHAGAIDVLDGVSSRPSGLRDNR
jgi:hypothetical protein